MTECGSIWDVVGGRTCHLSPSSDHFCRDKLVRISYQRTPDGEWEHIPFSSCNAEIEHAVVRALCEARRGPIVEANVHVAWAVNGNSSDTETATTSYLFIFEVSAFELFAFPVDGTPLSCSSYHHRGVERGIVCFIEAQGGSVAVNRYAYSNSERWSEWESIPGFVTDSALLTSTSFALQHCSSTTRAPFVIVGTTNGVEAIKLSYDLDSHMLTHLHALKLLRHDQCNALLYILTLEGVMVYDVQGLKNELFRPLNWSVAELSLDGSRIAFAGTHPDQSCWIQVWDTANQNVVLNVAVGECSIASMAVSEMHVCYHLTNVTNKEWKLACLVLVGSSEELVLSNSNRWGLKDRSLTLDGNILVERVWNTINLYRVHEKATLHMYKSKYPTLAYLPGTSGAQDSRCRIPPRIQPSPTEQDPSTSVTSLSEHVTPGIQPSPTTWSKPTESAVANLQSTLIIVVISGAGLFVAICVLLLVGVIFIKHCVKSAQGKYRTKEETPKNLKK